MYYHILFCVYFETIDKNLKYFNFIKMFKSSMTTVVVLVGVNSGCGTIQCSFDYSRKFGTRRLFIHRR